MVIGRSLSPAVWPEAYGLTSLNPGSSVCESQSFVFGSLQPRELYSPWNSLGQNTGVGSLFLLQRIFPTQGSNPGLLHCRQILYQLDHQGSPGSYSLDVKSHSPSKGMSHDLLEKHWWVRRGSCFLSIEIIRESIWKRSCERLYQQRTHEYSLWAAPNTQVLLGTEYLCPLKTHKVTPNPQGDGIRRWGLWDVTVLWAGSPHE